MTLSFMIYGTDIGEIYAYMVIGLTALLLSVRCGWMGGWGIVGNTAQLSTAKLRLGLSLAGS